MNILVIVAINNAHKDPKKLNDNMFKHIKINSSFNIVYCSIILFKPITECLYLTSSLYCSSLVTHSSAQYFKIIFIDFFGNSAKTCCNLSYSSIILSRFILMLDKKKGFFKLIKKFNPLFYIVFMVVFSLGLSVYKLFKYKVQTIDYTDFPFVDFPLEIHNYFYCNQEPSRIPICKLFYAFEMINNVFNDFVFFLLTLVLDLGLILELKKIIKLKGVLINKLKESEDEKKRSKIKEMVIINGIIFLVSHAPEFLVRLLILVYEKNLINFCYSKYTCDKIDDLAGFLNLFSIVMQIFIYMKFNRIIRDSFRSVKAKLMLKIGLTLNKIS